MYFLLLIYDSKSGADFCLSKEKNDKKYAQSLVTQLIRAQPSIINTHTRQCLLKKQINICKKMFLSLHNR